MKRETKPCGLVILLVLVMACTGRLSHAQDPDIRWTSTEITNTSGQKYIARSRYLKMPLRDEWQYRISMAQQPDTILLSRSVVHIASDKMPSIEMVDVHTTGQFMGFLIRRHYPKTGNSKPDYLYGLATNDVAKVAADHGYRHLPVGTSWTAVSWWVIDDIDESKHPNIRLLDARTLEATPNENGNAPPLKFEFSIDRAMLNGRVWKNQPPASDSMPVLFKFEDARKFLLSVTNLEVPTKATTNYRLYGEFIERHFSGLEQVREFFRPYAKDEAELSEFIQKLKAVQQAEIANVREFVRAYEERIKAGPPKPTPEEIEAERQRKLAEVEWRKKFDAEQEAKWQRHLQERRQKREELRKLREQMENDAE